MSDAPAPEGIAVLDKPAGWTSHDVVARVRRLLDTRRVGHAGTLDPMATGVLVVGAGRATRLLGHLAGHDKTYLATIRLGVTTSTDDADGEPLALVDAGGVGDAELAAALAGLTGPLLQVPPAVSAVKVDGRRAYARARAGETVELAARPVTVHALSLLARRGDDLDIEVRCSAGTYVRGLARDLGATLGVGAHLSALRRTRSGPFADPVPLPGEPPLALTGLAEAVRALFPARTVSGPELDDIRHGRPLAPSGSPAPGGPASQPPPPGPAGPDPSTAGPTPHPVGVFAPDGSLLALVADRDGLARAVVVFAPA